MSLTDPATRFLRRPALRRALPYVLWAVCFVAIFVATFTVGVDTGTGGGITGAIGMTVGIVAPIVASFADNAADPAADERSPWPYVLRLLGVGAAAFGAGLVSAVLVSVGTDADGVVADMGIVMAMAVGLAALTLGTTAAVAAPLLASHSDRIAQRRRTIALTGPRSRGRVTESRFAGNADHTKIYRVTIQFTDGQERRRWHTVTHYRSVPIGSRVIVRYDPQRPDRRSTILVEWNTRPK